MDLRGNRSDRLALEVPDPVPRPPYLQPVELRSRPLLPGARPGAGGSAGVLVGSVVTCARGRAGDHRGGWLRDPRAAAPHPYRRGLLALLRGRHRRARGVGSHDDGGVARWADRGLRVLVDARLVSRDPRLPFLHDHRPADDPDRTLGAPCVRHRRRPAGDAPDRAVHDRVRDQGRGSRSALRRLCRAPGPRAAELHPRRRAAGTALGRDPPESPRPRCARARRSTGVQRARRGRRYSRPPGDRVGDAGGERAWRTSRGHDRRVRGRRAHRPPSRAVDRARRRRRPSERGRRVAQARSRSGGSRRHRRVARGALEADPRVGRRQDRRADLRGQDHAVDARAGRGSGSADDRGRSRRRGDRGDPRRCRRRS